MYKKAKPFFIRTITPLHAGSGQDLGIVDLPIQRERHTGFPKIEASGLKGAIREAFECKAKTNEDKVKIHLAFGYDNSEKDKAVNAALPEKKEYAGALGFSDARLLLFPVKSAKGIFAWITCPTVLERFQKDLKICEIESKFKIPKIEKGKCIIFSDSVKFGDKVILEEYCFSIQTDSENVILQELEKNTNIAEIKDKLVIINDDDFADFVQLSTEVITRTKINNETGTVANGALFTEEYLPSETVMYSLAMFSPVFLKSEDKAKSPIKDERDVEKFFDDTIPTIMQIGGNATIGKGIVEILIDKEVKND